MKEIFLYRKTIHHTVSLFLTRIYRTTTSFRYPIILSIPPLLQFTTYVNSSIVTSKFHES